MTWLIHNISGTSDCVFSNDLVTLPPNSREEWLERVGTLEEWIQEQPQSLKLEQPAIDPSKLLTRDNDLIMYDTPGDVARVYIPHNRREALIDMAHQNLQHLGADKVLRALKHTYYWPKMPSMVRKRIGECLECNLC